VVRAKPPEPGECKDPQAVEFLIMVLKDPYPDVRFWAPGLGAIKDHRSAAPLIEALQDADAEVRYRVAEALGELKSPQAEDALSLALNDPERRCGRWRRGPCSRSERVRRLLSLVL